MKKFIISEDIRMGQSIVAIGLSFFAICLLVMLFYTGNINYIYILLFELIVFLPVYVLMSLRVYYVYLFDGSFYVSTIFKTVIIKQEEFADVIPIEFFLINFPRGYYKIWFNNGKMYQFSQREGLKTLFVNRQKKAKTIKQQILEEIRK